MTEAESRIPTATTTCALIKVLGSQEYKRIYMCLSDTVYAGCDDDRGVREIGTDPIGLERLQGPKVYESALPTIIRSLPDWEASTALIGSDRRF